MFKLTGGKFARLIKWPKTFLVGRRVSPPRILLAIYPFFVPFPLFTAFLLQIYVLHFRLTPASVLTEGASQRMANGELRAEGPLWAGQV
jgi:hypothetical protein